MLSLLWLLACGGGEPPTTHGMVLHVGSDTLLVQHDDLKGRVVAGVERYRVPEGTVVAPAEAGSHVDLWLEADALVRLSVTATDPLPKGFVAGGVPLTGTVVNIDGARLTVDHDAIPGVMGAMVMGFAVAPHEADRLQRGDTIAGRLIRSSYGLQLVDPVKTGEGNGSVRADVEPLAIGEAHPKTEVTVEDGSTVVLGEGQGIPTALTFVYTRCPDPSFCPAIAARLASLQGRLTGKARIVTVSLDPDNDSPPVLAAWGSVMGADTAVWRLGRLEPVELQQVALLGGQHVTVDGGRISHLHRLLILDSEGVLIERYDDNNWPMDRVVLQLTTGAPRPPKGPAGTKTK